MVRTLTAMVLLLACCEAQAADWRRLPSIPDAEGFAGSFAGISNGALLVAGGANFPDKKPWEGGKKIWYDTVFVLERTDGQWKAAGKLPQPLGYGVSVSHRGGVVCVGGSDADRHYADAVRLEWRKGKLITRTLPSLPRPLANASGCLVGDTLYIAGGIETPDSNEALRAVWRIDLMSARLKWEQIEDCPGSGRMLAVAAGLNGAFWLMGGAALEIGENGSIERRYLKEAYRFAPDTGWRQIADLPEPAVAAPSPAPTHASRIYVLGGDDGSQVDVAPNQHRDFSTTAFAYDTTAEKWVRAGDVVAPRVTVPSVLWNDSWVIPGGESRPGIRSPQVWSWTPGQPE